MKNFTKELKNILTEEYSGTPILSPDEVRGRANTMVILTNQAPKELLALAGPSREAILLNFKPLMITFPYQKGVYKVQPDDIVFENYSSDVTEAGSKETDYEKFFAAAMKKFGVSSPIELSPEKTKKFFNYVDKNWDAEEESDGSKNEILPAVGAAVGGLARGAMAVGRAASAIGSMGDSGDMDEVSREEKARRKKAADAEERRRRQDKAKADRAKGREQRAREKEVDAKRKERQDRIKSKAPDQKAKQRAMAKDKARRDYEREAKRKAAEREREREQNKRQKEREKARNKKKPSSIGKKLGVGMGADAAASKVSSAAQSALSKYKSKDSSI